MPDPRSSAPASTIRPGTVGVAVRGLIRRTVIAAGATVVLMGGAAGLVAASPPAAASPPPESSLTTTPDPAAVTLRTTAPTLQDSAVLSTNSGFSPTGTITFLLDDPSGSRVDTEAVSVNGDGTYTTPTGYTLPTTGTVTGTYQWDASYPGDSNNPAAQDTDDPAERVVVSAASPGLTTTPSPATVTLRTTAAKLTDSAVLSAGYYETGTITFTLHGPSGNLVDTETVTVNGNGTYTTPTSYTLPTTAATGTYQWDASYSGDGNNNAASETDNTNEQVTVVSAAALLADLAQKVRGLGFRTGLAGTVAVAQHQVAAGHPRLACLTLAVFVFEVQAQTPWRIHPGTAAQLITDAKRIRAVLGCGTGLF